MRVTFLGREFDLAPYKLGGMIAAAPFVDAQRERQEKLELRTGIHVLPTDPPDVRASKALELAQRTTAAEMMANLSDAVNVVHIGIAKLDPSITVEQLLDDVEPTPEGITALLTAMRAVLRQGGLVSGEATAPSVPAGAAAA